KHYGYRADFLGTRDLLRRSYTEDYGYCTSCPFRPNAPLSQRLLSHRPSNCSAFAETSLTPLYTPRHPTSSLACSSPQAFTLTSRNALRHPTLPRSQVCPSAQILDCLRLSALSGSPATARRPSSTDPGARAAHHTHPASLSPPSRPTATLAAAPTVHDALRTEISLERLLYSLTTAHASVCPPPRCLRRFSSSLLLHDHHMA
ncbi:hypothetical protein GN958_ATG01903, partial [Phytophthora infestans]